MSVLYQRKKNDSNHHSFNYKCSVFFVVIWMLKLKNKKGKIPRGFLGIIFRQKWNVISERTICSIFPSFFLLSSVYHPINFALMLKHIRAATVTLHILVEIYKLNWLFGWCLKLIREKWKHRRQCWKSNWISDLFFGLNLLQV